MAVEIADAVSVQKASEKKKNSEKCLACAYYNGECTKETPASQGMLLTYYQTRIIPEKGYPECQDEVSRNKNEQ